MASQINVCTPFSHCEKTKPSVHVFLLFRFAPVCVCVCMCAWYLCMLVCMCAYLAAAVVKTVARTNHYLVVAGLERSAVWNVRLCSTGARCSRALLKCPIKEGRVRFEWACVWESVCMCVWEQSKEMLCFFAVFSSTEWMYQSYAECKVYMQSIRCVWIHV